MPSPLAALKIGRRTSDNTFVELQSLPLARSRALVAFDERARASSRVAVGGDDEDLRLGPQALLPLGRGQRPSRDPDPRRGARRHLASRRAYRDRSTSRMRDGSDRALARDAGARRLSVVGTLFEELRRARRRDGLAGPQGVPRPRASTEGKTPALSAAEVERLFGACTRKAPRPAIATSSSSRSCSTNGSRRRGRPPPRRGPRAIVRLWDTRCDRAPEGRPRAGPRRSGERSSRRKGVSEALGRPGFLFPAFSPGATADRPMTTEAARLLFKRACVARGPRPRAVLAALGAGHGDHGGAPRRGAPRRGAGLRGARSSRDDVAVSPRGGAARPRARGEAALQAGARSEALPPDARLAARAASISPRSRGAPSCLAPVDRPPRLGQPMNSGQNGNVRHWVGRAA